jgi:hypothetical protein
MTGGLLTSLLGLYFGVRRLKTDLLALIGKLSGRKNATEITRAA